MNTELIKAWAFRATHADLAQGGYDDLQVLALGNIAVTFFARGKSIEDMTDADFALIGAHMAQWFQRHFIEPMLMLEKDTVARRLEDEAEMS